MIESLNGIFETINYKQSTSIKLYDNDEYEDYPAHWHTNPEIIMPTENIYTVECYNQIITLREGDIVLICPGCIHTLYAPEKGRRIIFQADINPLRFMKEIETLVTIISPLIVITPEDFPSIYDKVKSLLLKIKNEYLSGFSKFYFSRLFKQFTNVSFYKYVNQKRIEKAAEMLTEPNISITNVALSCGFESLSSFIRMFKIVKGLYPYRIPEYVPILLRRFHT
jgi:araC-type DNA-binding domain-containing proteins